MELLKDENDFYTSVIKSFDEIDDRWRDYEGLCIVGSHTPKRIKDKINKIQIARENDIPFLGICMGMQLMAIEWMRNKAGFPTANTQEVDPKTPEPIVRKLRDLQVGIRDVKWFDGETTQESHWHHYTPDMRYFEYFTDWDFSTGPNAVEIMRYRKNNFFWGVQFHPEYQSTKEKPHHLLKEFLFQCRIYTQDKHQVWER